MPLRNTRFIFASPQPAALKVSLLRIPAIVNYGGKSGIGVESCRLCMRAVLDSTCIYIQGKFMKLQSLPCYCATVRQVARAVTVLYEELLADSGLHATQYTALQVLDSVPNPSTTELAAAIGIDQTTATRTLALIRKSGLAIDTVGDDRRQRRWALTAEGQARLRKLRPTWEAAQEAFEKRLGRAQARALKKASYLAASRLASS